MMLDYICMKMSNVKKAVVQDSAAANSSRAVAKRKKAPVNIFSKKTLLVVAKYAVLAVALFALSNAYIYGVRPFGAAFYFALLFFNVPFLIISPIFVLAEFASSGLFGLFSGLLIVAIFGGSLLLKRYLKSKNKSFKWCWFVLPLFATVAHAAFMPFTDFNVLHVALYTLLIFGFVQAVKVALRPIIIEKLKYKMLEVELLCFAAIIIASGAGLSGYNLWGFPLGVLFASFITFTAAKTAGGAKAIVAAVLFGLGHAFTAFDPTMLAAYVFFAALAVSFSSAPKILMPLSALAGFLIYAFFFFNETLPIVLWVSAIAVSGLAYMLTPLSFLANIKSYLFDTHDKTAVRYMIQRDRQELSKKLHSAAGVFNAMSYTLENSIKKPPDYTGSLSSTCCALCEHDNACRRAPARDTALDKMLETVFTNGRATLADIPDYLTDRCKNLAKLLSSASAIAESRNHALGQIASEKHSRSIVAHQMNGMSGVLNDLALNTETAVSMDLEREKVLIEELNYASIATSQALIAKEVVTLILRTETFDRSVIEKTVSRITKQNYKVASIDDTLLAGFSCIILVPKPATDIVFGVASVAKRQGEANGDSHSFIKIGHNRFMMALSDGMGSGAGAANTSGTALGLVENFYRAGFNGELVLKSVNRFLASTGGDNFSALDICVVDLDSLDTDIVKLASPSTYIKRQNTVERIEGSGAPMGVLEHIEPRSTRLNLVPNDMIILASDGVQDSFNGDKLSAAINNIKTKNPQALAEGILEYAMHNNGGSLNDDSTVLVARIVANMQ